MAYSVDLLKARPDPAIGFADVDQSIEIEAGYGECKLCGCTAFQEGGYNSEQCANSSCGHSKDDHRY